MCHREREHSARARDSCDVDDELWRSAQELLDERQLLDVLLLCGWYHAICFAARTARVDLEPGAPRFADITAALANRVVLEALSAIARRRLENFHSVLHDTIHTT